MGVRLLREAEIKKRGRDRGVFDGLAVSRSIYHLQIPYVKCVHCREERGKTGNAAPTADGLSVYFTRFQIISTTTEKLQVYLLLSLPLKTVWISDRKIVWRLFWQQLHCRIVRPDGEICCCYETIFWQTSSSGKTHSPSMKQHKQNPLHYFPLK